jgi:hypothetical protein
MDENELSVLAENRQIRIPKKEKVCGTYDVPQTLYRPSADVAADITADVERIERPTSIPDPGF